MGSDQDAVQTPSGGRPAFRLRAPWLACIGIHKHTRRQRHVHTPAWLVVLSHLPTLAETPPVVTRRYLRNIILGIALTGTTEVLARPDHTQANKRNQSIC